MITTTHLVLVSSVIAFTISWWVAWLMCKWSQAKRRGKILQAYVDIIDWMARNNRKYIENYVKQTINQSLEFDEAYRKWIQKD
jgi:hypothetical protein